ncbi:MAG TPA: polysaccharide deacetylase, partial [Actinomycetota bacterium]|nr:polysaccharide deacetylase [Actinomycetota bacterium]
MSSRPVILAYHAIGECPRERDPGNLFVTPAAFERQMSYLARRKKVVSLEQALANPTGDNVIVITFDDAYRNVLTQAGPILARYG